VNNLSSQSPDVKQLSLRRLKRDIYEYFHISRGDEWVDIDEQRKVQLTGVWRRRVIPKEGKDSDYVWIKDTSILPKVSKGELTSNDSWRVLVNAYRSVDTLTRFKVGDYVLRAFPTRIQDDRFGAFWKGPYIVESIINSQPSYKNMLPRHMLSRSDWGRSISITELRRILSKLTDGAYHESYGIRNLLTNRITWCHVSLLKHFVYDPRFTIPLNVTRKDNQEYFIVASIVDHRQIHGKFFFRVRWEGYDAADDTWEPLSHVRNVGKFHDYAYDNQLQRLVPAEFKR
jgi:hypothetical protein